MFTIQTFWDDTPCTNPLLHGTVDVVPCAEGVQITAMLPHQPVPNIPRVPKGTRVANLWEYDVVECFLVGTSTYLEVELGAGGHFLVLDFSAPRVRKNDYTDFAPSIVYEHDAERGCWRSSVVIPTAMIPEGLHAANAFVIVGENYLCASPLPGPQADFHQPDRFLPFTLA